MAGEVSGAPGTSYPQRTDLNSQPVRAATGQPYGAAGAQRAAQQAVPLPEERGMPTPLSAPSSRPDEPITAGAPFGAGRNSMAIPAPAQGDRTLDMLRSMYAAWPDESLRELIQRVEETGQ